jgi:hypothetical protein
LDRQLLVARLFKDEYQLVGGSLQLGLSGPVLPQISLMVASEFVNLPLNQAVASVAG